MKSILKTIRRKPSHIIIDMFEGEETIRGLISAATLGHLVFVGVNVKNNNSAKDELFNCFIKENGVNIEDIILFERLIKVVIDLD